MRRPLTDPYSGLGVWTEDFDRPTHAGLSIEDLKAVERVAPIVGPAGDDDLCDTRRFVHRTIFEHLVAEHIATLSTQQALEVLLPHLWFDPDWEVTAPSAIAAHPQRGEILSSILECWTKPGLADDVRRKTADQQIEALLVAVATESDPTDWPQDLQNAIVDALMRAVTSADLALAKQWAKN